MYNTQSTFICKILKWNARLFVKNIKHIRIKSKKVSCFNYVDIVTIDVYDCMCMIVCVWLYDS